MPSEIGWHADFAVEQGKQTSERAGTALCEIGGQKAGIRAAAVQGDLFSCEAVEVAEIALVEEFGVDRKSAISFDGNVGRHGRQGLREVLPARIHELRLVISLRNLDLCRAERVRCLYGERDIAEGRLVELTIEDLTSGGLIMPMSAVYPTSGPPGPAGRWLIEWLKRCPKP